MCQLSTKQNQCLACKAIKIVQFDSVAIYQVRLSCINKKNNSNNQ